MGSGKTEAMLSMINDDPEGNYIFVTPYLDEVERVKRSTKFGRFKDPKNYGESKLESFHKLLADGEDIATTHSLFLRTTSETEQLISEGGYTLILDEALDVFQDYNSIVEGLQNKTVDRNTVRWLKNEGLISVSDSYQVEWTGGSVPDFSFSEVERLADRGCLRCIDDVFCWEFPIDILRAFQNVYVLTYMMEGSFFDSYLHCYDIPYEKVSANRNEDGKFCLCPYTDALEHRKELATLIDIYDGEGKRKDLNRIGDGRNAFSASWLKNRTGNDMRTIRSHMKSYKRKFNPNKSFDLMWTTLKQGGVYESLAKELGFRFTRPLTGEEQILPEDDERKRRLSCYVPCNARATNNFRSRKILLYLLNRFPNPEHEKYYRKLGFPIDRDAFALAEMLQWIWRSAIRDGKPIHIYIPSKRMRKLLKNWLGIKDAGEKTPFPVAIQKASNHGFSESESLKGKQRRRRRKNKVKTGN